MLYWVWHQVDLCVWGGVWFCFQVGASMMDPNHFLMIVLSRFELFHIFSSADCRKRYREANKVSTDSTDALLTVVTPSLTLCCLCGRMWCSRTTLWSRRCFTSSSWLLVSLCRFNLFHKEKFWAVKCAYGYLVNQVEQVSGFSGKCSDKTWDIFNLYI